MLTETEMLESLISYGKEVRFWQRKYAKVPKSEKIEKKMALIEWKTAERTLFKALDNFTQLMAEAKSKSKSGCQTEC